MDKGKITLIIPSKFFNKDFLDIEVKKGLGIRGDSLIQHFKGEMRDLHKHNRNSNLFSHNMIYMCKANQNNVVLTGPKI